MTLKPVISLILHDAISCMHGDRNSSEKMANLRQQKALCSLLVVPGPDFAKLIGVHILESEIIKFPRDTLQQQCSLHSPDYSLLQSTHSSCCIPLSPPP